MWTKADSQKLIGRREKFLGSNSLWQKLNIFLNKTSILVLISVLQSLILRLQRNLFIVTLI